MEVVTALVLTVKFVVVAPATTVTLAGTVAAETLLERETRAALLGAGALRVTVPVEEDPPVTLVGLSATEESVGDAGGLPMSQEAAQSEIAKRPATATRPGRWREVRIKLQSVDNTASQANKAAHVAHKRIGGVYRGKAKGDAKARAIVANVTVAVDGFVPSSFTDDGETVHVAWAGAPMQLQITV